MSPGNISCLDPEKARQAGCREASVLILLYPVGGAIRFPLILRPDSDGPHGGQIGLPGGSLEEGEGAAEAALRETEEELGVPPKSVDILGALSETHVPPSGYLVRPFVGWISTRPLFRPSAAEVAGIVEPSLEELLDPARRLSETREIGGRGWTVPFFRLAGHDVWGATARMLAELAALLEGV